jgi:hypothetical protein
MLLRHFSYVDRGRYARQLEAWFAHFDRRRMLILCSERFFADPASIYTHVLRFLELAPFTPANFAPQNETGYAPSDAHGRIRSNLVQRLAEENERLFSLLGERFPWRNAVEEGWNARCT